MFTGWSLKIIVFALVCLSALQDAPAAQEGTGKKPEPKNPQPKVIKIAPAKAEAADPLEAQRRAVAISLLTALADEARNYRNPALRSNVTARVADLLWEADSATARSLFRRAWEAAEKGDAEEIRLKTKDRPPPMVAALRRIAGRDLRAEVMSLAARRDRALGEEFLAKLNENAKRDPEGQSGVAAASDAGDPWLISEAAAKRLQTARGLLDAGQLDQALEIAAPALERVNANTITFLSALREKRHEVADRIFASLLARAEADPSSDANTVSGLSSYALTPGLYITFWPTGGSTWSQETEAARPPALPEGVRTMFLRAAAGILLRPLPPPDQDRTTSGRLGAGKVINRLLPLFDQYMPDVSTELRARLAALAADVPANALREHNALLNTNRQPDNTPSDSVRSMEDHLAGAKTLRERDLIYAEAAAALASEGDSRAQELAEKIEEAERRERVRQYVNLQLAQSAIRKKDADEVIRLARSMKLTHQQRAWVYTEAARALMKAGRGRALEFLDEAADEARRIGDDNPDRARLLVGVATQLAASDPVRAWEVMGEVVKTANTSEGFTGAGAEIHLPVATRSGVRLVSIGGPDFGLSGVLRLLARDDLYRAADVARSFEGEAARANATLAIAGAVLGK